LSVWRNTLDHFDAIKAAGRIYPFMCARTVASELPWRQAKRRALIPTVSYRLTGSYLPLKAAWERGEHDGFYPYGKTYGQVFREQE